MEPMENAPTAPQKSGKTMKMILVFVLILSIVANGLLAFFVWKQSGEIEALNDIYSSEYFHYNSLTVEGFEEKVAAGDDFVAIITRPDCPSCEAVYEDVMAVTEEMGINDDIYFLNVVYLRQDQTAWDAFKEKYGIQGTPTYGRFSGGELISQVGWTPERGVNAEDAQAWFEQQSDLWD